MYCDTALLIDWCDVCVQDALQAQMVIKKMSEMIDSKPSSQDTGIGAALSNNNGVIQDKENNIEVRYNLFWCVFYI